MKKLLVMAAMVLSSVGAFAQYSAGDITIQPKIGLNVASVGGDIDGDYKAGLAVGAEAEYHVSPLIGVSAGLLYSQQGYKWSAEDEDESDFKWKPAYLNIPILANFYVAKGFAFKAGIQPGFNVNDKAKASGSGASVEMGLGDLSKGFVLAVPIGLSYEFSNIQLDARFNWGVTHAISNSYDSCNSNTFMITLGYKFSL